MDRKEAEKFFDEWVWASPKRKSHGVGWPEIYKRDVVSMLVDASQKTKTKDENNGPKIVTICGSSRFVDIMAVCAWILERDEQAIVMSLHLLPGWYSKELIPDHLAEHEGVADQMDELHFRKIDLSGEIFVVNYSDYIGESTTKEIEYAEKTGADIRWFTHDPVGKKVTEIANNFIKTKHCLET